MVEMVWVLRNSLDNSFIAYRGREKQIKTVQKGISKRLEEGTHYDLENREDLYKELYSNVEPEPESDSLLPQHALDTALVTFKEAI